MSIEHAKVEDLRISAGALRGCGLAITIATFVLFLLLSLTVSVSL